MRIKITLFLIFAFIYGCAPVLVGHTSFIETKLLESKEKGIELYERGELKGALERFMEALRIARSIDNRKEEAASLINIGRALVVMGKHVEAEAFLSEAVSVASTLKDEPGLSDAYATLAKVSYMRRDYSSALDRIEEALSIDMRLGVRHGSRLNMKGLIYIKVERFDEAEGVLKEALERNSAGEDSLETANSFRALAVLMALRYSDTEAFAFFLKAYEIDRILGDPEKIAWDLNAMAELHRKSGELDMAAGLFERSYIVAMNSGRETEALRILESLISAYRELGDEKKALYYTSMKEGILRKWQR